MTPTQRTLRALRNKGMVASTVNSYAGLYGVRQDLFGIIGILALDPRKGVIGIQSCDVDFPGHRARIIEDLYQEAMDWLRTPETSLELWGWRKVKLRQGGTEMRWEPRIARFAVDGDQIVVTEAS